MDDQVTAAVNKHMTHAEDLIFYGERGLSLSFKLFTSLFNELKGSAESDKSIKSVKIDGAPALYCASSFYDLGGPFVATKGIFAKDPKVCYTDEDIQRLYADKPGLVEKLSIALRYLKEINIPANEIWQGDQLFTKSTLKTTTIDGKETFVFKPNTIVYTVPVDSEMGKDIAQAEIGIAWHTRYTGKDLTSMRASYDISTSELKQSKNVFSMDVYLTDLSGKISLTAEETEVVERSLTIAKDLAASIDKQMLTWLSDNEQIKVLFMTFENALIRQDIQIDIFEEYLAKLIEWLQARFTAELATRKTEKGKGPITLFYNNLFAFLQAPASKKFIEDIFNIQQALVLCKRIFIKKFESMAKFNAYFDNNGSLKKTNQEGFAISDIQGNIVKLVDRYEFSKMNFNAGSFAKKETVNEAAKKYVALTNFLETKPVTAETVEFFIKEFNNV